MQNSQYQYTFTVFTPTYNRAYSLPRVYQSLVRQTYRDFEWLIVDDGSTDNTAEVVETFVKEARFSVRYIQKPNGGKHTAVNAGVNQARGRFLAILDSDDWYLDDALEKMLDFWNLIEDTDKSKFCGVCGLCAYENGKIVGSKFPKDIWDSNDFEFKNIYRIVGDKKGFKRTDVMRQFPFPEDVGNFVNESIVWNRIGRVYSTRFVNIVFTKVQYQIGGLSDIGRISAVRNPRAKVLLLSELLNCGIRLPFLISLKSTINLIRYSLHAHLPIKDLYNNLPNKITIFPYFPAAVMLVFRDRYFLWQAAKKD